MIEDAMWWFLWNVARDKTGTPWTKKSTVSSIFENGKWPTENLSVAKIMNQYFVSVGKALAKPFQNVSTAFNSSTPPSEFHLDNVNVNFVRNTLNLTKPQGPEEFRVNNWITYLKFHLEKCLYLSLSTIN